MFEYTIRLSAEMSPANQTLSDRIRSVIRDVPDFPKPGIIFKDITPLLQDPELCSAIVDGLCRDVESLAIDAIVGIESRGFLFGVQMAQQLNVPFVPIRKKGKLPHHTHAVQYELEYGTAEIEMHRDGIQKGMKVLVHDDLLATGGTAIAAADLIAQAAGQVAGFSFLVELGFLNGQKPLMNISNHVKSLVSY
jgi:adenine phosphoribosyltransferase